MKPLDERERAFVRALTGSARGNITKAAIAAGCSEKSAARIGHRLSKRVHVQEAIQAIHQKLDAKALLTAEDVDRALDAIIGSTPDKPPTHGERLKAIELKGKRLKMWQEPSGSGITVNIGFLSATDTHTTVVVTEEVRDPASVAVGPFPAQLPSASAPVVDAALSEPGESAERTRTVTGESV